MSLAKHKGSKHNLPHSHLCSQAIENASKFN